MNETDHAPPQGDATPEEADSPPGGVAFPVVGVGASAGGLEALSQLLGALPVDTGMAFVIVQHLSPDRPSSLTQILGRRTPMTVCEVDEACGEPAVEADHVYVIPPGRDMFIAGGRLKLGPQLRQGRPHGIDLFFRSLAQDCRHKAIGVVLSGSLNDGTLGLEAIKAEGGITFAQDDSAQHDSMPQSAVASGCVDYVLAPVQIAAEIARIAHDPYVAPAAEVEAGAELGYAGIMQMVQRATGVDFTHYKTSTMHRRIRRRMVLQKQATQTDYAAYLGQNPAEMEALYQDLLIGVSSFFRDAQAFEVLARTAFPKLLAGRTSQEPLRIWSIGCSTGEEAYSLAIAFTECAEALRSEVPLHLLATDINHYSIGKARAGLYPMSIAQDVSPERLQRCFIEEAGGYRIRKEIRERCVFSRHNMLADPPFSRMDVISCRNMLIYLEPVLQEQVLRLMHYALKPGGYLLLGSSETPGSLRALFDVADARHKIFIRRPGSGSGASPYRPVPGGVLPGTFSTFPPPARDSRPTDVQKEVERLLLAQYAPPGVVISAGMEVLQFRGDTGAFLAPAQGVASLHLLKMLREGLLVGVRAAVLRAVEEGRTVRQEGLRVKSGEGWREAVVQVSPLPAEAKKERSFLVLFEASQREPEALTRAQVQGIESAEATRDELLRLTQELASTREYLQKVPEQHESANEELQSINEEAQSANEEMQSVNEELETSKEEIQSTNEELASLNDELNNRNLELQQLSTSLRLSGEYAMSIVKSMRSPLLVLDAALRVKTVSEVFYTAFQVSPTETEGRLIYELGNGQWNIPALRRLLEELLPKAHVIDDFEVRHDFEQIGPRIMLLNARRLPQGKDKEPLIVLAFEDITQRAQAEEAVGRLAAIITSSDDAIISKDLDGIIMSWNRGAERIFGYTAGEVIGRPVTVIIPPDRIAEEADILGDLRRGGRLEHFETRRQRKDGALIDVSLTISPILDSAGHVVGASKIARDITGRKQAEAALRESENFNRSIVESSRDCIKMLDLEGRLLSMSRLGQELLGIADIQPYLGKYWADFWQGAEREAAHRAAAAARAGGMGTMMGSFRTLRDEPKWFDVVVTPILDADGTPVRLLAVSRDITERRHAELDAAFLAAASQDLANFSDVAEIMQTVGARLGEHLELSLCNFVDVNEADDEIVVAHAWHRPEVPSSIGRYRLSEHISADFQATLRAGAASVVRDTSTDPRTDALRFAALKMGSFVCMPLVRDGQWRFMLNIFHAGPHDWQPHEIELVRELATRLWSRLERVRMEEALRESEERFRMMANSAPQLAWTAWPGGDIFWYNQRWYDYTGTTPEAMQGWGWQSVHDPAELPRVLERWKASIATGEPFEMTFPLRGADGSFRLFLTRVIPLKDAEGRVMQWFGTNTDVSELKRVEAVLAARVADLARADRSKDEFLAMLAHELRNPLAPMRNAVTLLDAPHSTSDERANSQRILARQIDNMGRMIDDLLDVSRITEGKIQLQRQAVGLEAILTAATSLVRSSCAAQHQELALSLPDEPVFLNADATRLEQVFGNLLTNACKYSGEGSHITLSAEREDGTEPPQVIVRVRDDGQGIAPELLPHVFDLFVQSSRSLDRAHGGLGIGLTLVQRLVQQHGGSVEAHSEGIGHGSEFVVHLPILTEAPPPAPLPPPPKKPEAPRRILIVDDNQDAATSLATLQKRRGHDTRSAFTGPDAVAAAAEFLPEVVLLDIGLPGMDGFEVARRIRAMPALKGAFLVAMSGYGEAPDRATAKEAGFDKYMVKPASLAQLSEWLRERE